MIFILVLFLFISNIYAEQVEDKNQVTQESFKQLSEDAQAALSSTPLYESNETVLKPDLEESKIELIPEIETLDSNQEIALEPNLQPEPIVQEQPSLINTDEIKSAIADNSSAKTENSKDVDENLDFTNDIPTDEDNTIEKVEQKLDVLQENLDEKKEKLEPEFEMGKLELLDKIEAEIITSTPESTDTQIITTSDITKRGFDGGKYTVNDLIDEALADNLGKTFKISLTDDDVNKYLKRANLNTKQQIKELTEKWGYENVEEFYENFKKIYRANTALNYEMSSQIVVTEDEIKEYFDTHPINIEAVYTIETTFVLHDSTKTKQELKEELEQYVNGTKNLNYIIWDLPIKVKKSEISNASRFLEDMTVGSIYIKELSDGFDLFKLICKEPDRVIPFEERKKDIINTLQNKKHEDAYLKVKNNLLDKAIIYVPDQKVPENIKELGL